MSARQRCSEGHHVHNSNQKGFCKGQAKPMGMKSAFQANFRLQTQLLLLWGSHKAWLECQLCWGQSCVKNIHHSLGRNMMPLFTRSGYLFHPGQEQWLSPATRAYSGACCLHHWLLPRAPAMLALLSYQETILYMRSQTLYKVLSALACVSALCKTHGDGNAHAKLFEQWDWLVVQGLSWGNACF